MPRELFKTEPHGAQTVFVDGEESPLHNQMFVIKSEPACGSATIVLTGEELLNLCCQFSDHVRDYRRSRMKPKGLTTQQAARAEDVEITVIDSLLDRVGSSLRQLSIDRNEKKECGNCGSEYRGSVCGSCAQMR